MRQFDVFVFEKDNPNFNQWKPEFEDSALGWFHDSDWNSSLQKIEGEWIIFSHPSIKIDRDFLNNLAECVEGFPMVDAFAPRLKFEGNFYGGLLLNGAKGFAPISENEKMRFVAAPNPFIGVFSSRIIQRTGLFDQTLPPEFRLLDYTLRMAHAGGKMFSVPYLVAQVKDILNDTKRALVNGDFLQAATSLRPEWQIIYKSLGVSSLLGFSVRHPSTLPLFFNTKELKFKRDKATALSKFSDQYRTEISL